MLTARLTKPLEELTVLDSVHAFCVTHQTSRRSVCSAYCEGHQTFSLTSNTGTHFSFSPSHRGPKRDYIKMLCNILCCSKSYKHRFSFFVVNGFKFQIYAFVIYTILRWIECYSFFRAVAVIRIWRRRKGNKSFILRIGSLYVNKLRIAICISANTAHGNLEIRL